MQTSKSSDNKEKIMKCTASAVRKYGLAGVRVHHIAKLAGMTPSNLYTHFSGKEELLQLCFDHIDRQIASLFQGMSISAEMLRAEPDKVVWTLWSTYFRWLIDNPDETFFYFSFRTAPGFKEYDKVRDISWWHDFVSIVNSFDGVYGIYGKMSPHILWTHVLSVTQLYAVQIIEGFIPGDEESINNIFLFMMNGISVILRG